MRAATLLPLLAIGSVATTSPRGGLLQGRDFTTIDRSIHRRDLAHEIWARINNGATCSGCQGILMFLKAVAAMGDSPFIKTIQGLCKVAKVVDDDVCHGIIELEGPALAAAVRDMSLYSTTSNTFCASLLGLCDYPQISPWPIPLPDRPRPSPGRPTASNKKSLQIIHFSDIHVDSEYTVGANTQCTKPICCRTYTDADAPGVTKNPAGLFGDHMCDSSASLEQSMYKAIRELVPNAEFAMFTGDIVEHNIWNSSEAANTRSIQDGMIMMETHLKMVYSTIGNHEQSPVNLIPPNEYGDSARWLYRLLSGYWTKWLGEETRHDIERTGAYSVKHKPMSPSSGSNLRIISLNTNLYYRLNFMMYRSTMPADPNGQLAWLAEQLADAERAGDRVYIIGHMPLGDPDALHDPSSAFGLIANRFSDTIAAMFFGHTHVDHFELHYADGSDTSIGVSSGSGSRRSHSDARVMSYIAPSLTPTSGMPSFRVYDVDPDTWAVRDVIQYAVDMDSDPAFAQSNSRGGAEPRWKKLYSARESYAARLDAAMTAAAGGSKNDRRRGGIGGNHRDELSPAFWHNITELFETDDAVFQEYVGRKSRGWKVEHCGDGPCKATEICMLRAGRAQDNCHAPQPGLHLSRRDGHGGSGDGHDRHGHGHGHRHHGHRHHAHRHRPGNNIHDDCGASPSAMTMAQLATSREMIDALAELYAHFSAEMH